MFLFNEMIEEILNFNFAHILGVAQLVKANIPDDPTDICLFCAGGVTFQPQFVSDLVDEFWLLCHGDVFCRIPPRCIGGIIY